MEVVYGLPRKGQQSRNVARSQFVEPEAQVLNRLKDSASSQFGAGQSQ